ncbi:MAG: penicillin-binding protein [Acidimicrobiales bacterium]
MGLLAVIVVAFVAIVGRLSFVQGFAAGPYAAMGLSERIHSVTLPADRGSIFDRNGDELAMSVPQSSVWADPRLVTEPAREAQALATVLRLDVPVVQDRLTRPGAFSYVARTVDDAIAAQVKGLNLPGVSLLAEPKRFFPDGNLASPVVGQVGTDETGLSGLEGQYQSTLSGHPGKLVSEDDPSGRPIPGGLRRLTPATRGSDLVLTLDRSMQYEVEQELAKQIGATHAKGGMAVVMDTATGELLAMASLTNAADGSGIGPAPSNQVVTSVYEPGSVNKLITMSAALEEHVVAPADLFTVPDSIRVADTVFHDDNPHPIERWSVTDILTASSNVGTIKIGKELGKDRLDSYLRKFGLGSRSALHFPGESRGLLLDPAKWYSTSIGTVPIGQGIAVTAIQLAAAYNTVANGGVYIAPKLVRAVVGPQGRVQATPPSATHRVVSSETSRQMTAMLTEVVRTGTGTAAAVDGYAVAGKTGTARKSIEGQQGYKEGAYIASFAGFVPAEKPVFTAMVVLDEPTPIFGGLTAAPVFARIAPYALRELQVPPPPADPRMFDGVPRAVASVASAADEPTALTGAKPTVTSPTGTEGTQPQSAQPGALSTGPSTGVAQPPAPSQSGSSGPPGRSGPSPVTRPSRMTSTNVGPTKAAITSGSAPPGSGSVSTQTTSGVPTNSTVP